MNSSRTSIASTIILACTFSFVLAAHRQAQSPIYTLKGGSSAQMFGAAGLATPGDVDQDGYPDLAVGLAFVERVYIYSGKLGTKLIDLSVSSIGTLAGPGDVNGDGFPDLLAGQPGIIGTGQVWAFSGKTWNTLYDVDGTPNMGYWFGSAMDGIGDVNLDGNADFIIGDHGEDLVVADQGSVRVCSGMAGTAFHTIMGEPMPFQRFGYSVSSTGDIDGDGTCDWVAGTDEFDILTTAYARVYSTATGNVIHHFQESEMSPNYGNSVTGPGDVDADGVPDVVIGDPWNVTAGPKHGAIHLYSGGSGELLYTLYGDNDNGLFGYRVSDAGDLDADGSADFLVADINPGSFRYVRLYNGASGAELFTLQGSADGSDTFGHLLASAGDINGDGTSDIAVAAPGQYLGVVGEVRVFSGKPLPLSSDGHLFSVSAPGLVNLRLNAGLAHAGELYLLAGTLSGTSPGIPIDSVVVPLNPDAYLLHTVGSPNSPPLADSLGFLSGSGVGLAQFALPPGPPYYPSLIGKSAYHAYALLGPAGVSLASNAVPLTFIP